MWGNSPENWIILQEMDGFTCFWGSPRGPVRRPARRPWCLAPGSPSGGTVLGVHSNRFRVRKTPGRFHSIFWWFLGIFCGCFGDFWCFLWVVGCFWWFLGIFCGCFGDFWCFLWVFRCFWGDFVVYIFLEALWFSRTLAEKIGYESQPFFTSQGK